MEKTGRVSSPKATLSAAFRPYSLQFLTGFPMSIPSESVTLHLTVAAPASEALWTPLHGFPPCLKWPSPQPAKQYKIDVHKLFRLFMTFTRSEQRSTGSSCLDPSSALTWLDFRPNAYNFTISFSVAGTRSNTVLPGTTYRQPSSLSRISWRELVLAEVGRLCGARGQELTGQGNVVKECDVF